MSSFFFNDTATTEIYTLSLHDALPIYMLNNDYAGGPRVGNTSVDAISQMGWTKGGQYLTRLSVLEIGRAQSELQSLAYLVCRLLLEKKKKKLDRMHRHVRGINNVDHSS